MTSSADLIRAHVGSRALRPFSVVRPRPAGPLLKGMCSINALDVADTHEGFKVVVGRIVTVQGDALDHA
jgi:hypothetical protein